MIERELNQKTESLSSGYTIRTSYGTETLENCMLQVINMVVTQSLQQENNSVV